MVNPLREHTLGDVSVMEFPDNRAQNSQSASQKFSLMDVLDQEDGGPDHAQEGDNTRASSKL